jgi:4-methylaminobutanoate oxidase (formaldehyde-forming)
VNEQLLNNTMSVTSVYEHAHAPLPERARVVVIGGGIIGTSVAHHLAALGVADVVVLERHRLTAGTTWHPAGLLASARATHVLSEMAAATLELYASLEARTGLDVGFNRRGCITVARTEARMTELRYAMTMARHHGVEVHELAPEEIVARHPLVDATGAVGAVHFPLDGTVNPGSATLALAKLATDAGVAFREGVTVERILVRDGRVHGVQTSAGPIECESVAVCGGLWSSAIARTAGVDLALHAAEHMWVLTDPIDGARDDQPYVRDLDGHFYVRGYRGGLLVGAFEPNGKPRTVESLPSDFAFGEFEPDREHFAPALDRARERFPVLRDATIARWLNAPESFTPDGAMLLGETPEVAGLFVLAGMNSQGILMGPGAARALAEWIVEGGPTVDAGELHVGRFSAVQTSAPYLFDRTRETLGRLYGMHWPRLQPDTARGMRRTPLYEQLARAGAVFGEQNGWERANWYAPAGVTPEYRYSYDRPNWFEHVGREHRAARENVALFDLSSFAKFLVQGPGALAGVQRIFTGDLDVAVGKVVYTSMLNERGGVEVDLTVTRLGESEFLVVAPTVAHDRTGHWLRRHVGEGAVVTDVTAAYATLAVQGPQSRALLSAITDADLSSEAFPFATARWIDVAGTRALALRVSFVGELGWELYPSSETAAWLHDAIVEAGAGLSLRHAGYFALDTLRSEKGFVHWGVDVGPSDTPLETGLGFTVAWDKPVAFIGKDALARVRAQPKDTRLVHLQLTDPGAQLYHGESVLADGRIVGRVTSGNYGHALGSAVGLAFVDLSAVHMENGAVDDGIEVEVAGTRVPARLSRRPLYDPTGERMRA